jgi:hypothetical protein
MDLFLTILKFAGIIVSGALGILGTITETRNKKTGRLTHWGKWALNLTVAGFATALLAQIAEQIKGQRDSQKAQEVANHQMLLLSNSVQQASQQIGLAQASLDQIERVTTRLEDFKAITTFECPAYDFDFSGLVTEQAKTNLVQLSAKGLLQPGQRQIFKLGGFVVTNEIFSESVDSQRAPPAGFETSDGVTYGNIIGYTNAPDGVAHIGSFYQEGYWETRFDLEVFGTNAVVPLVMDQLEQLQKPLEKSRHNPDDVLQFLKRPKIVARIWANNSSTSDDPDFLAGSVASKTTKIEYLFPSDRFRVTVSCDFPGSNWIRKPRIVSLPDLSDGKINFVIQDYPLPSQAYLTRIKASCRNYVPPRAPPIPRSQGKKGPPPRFKPDETDPLKINEIFGPIPPEGIESFIDLFARSFSSKQWAIGDRSLLREINSENENEMRLVSLILNFNSIPIEPTLPASGLSNHNDSFAQLPSQVDFMPNVLDTQKRLLPRLAK